MDLKTGVSANPDFEVHRSWKTSVGAKPNIQIRDYGN